MGNTAPPDKTFPLPSPAFSNYRLPIVAVAQPLVRVHRVGHGAIFFGRTGRHRWDDPARQYGVLYASFEAEGAFVETFLADAPATISSAYGGSIPVSGIDLAMYGLSEIQLKQPLQAVDLRAGGVVAIGATGVIVTGPHAASQVWSRALFTHPRQPDAIVSPAKMDLSRVTVAIHERAKQLVAAKFLGPLSGLPNIMENITAAYPIVIVG